MIEAAMLHWLLVQLPRDDADVLTEWIVRTSGYDPHSVEALRLGDSGNVWLSTLFAHHGHAHWQGPFGVLPGALERLIRQLITTSQPSPPLIATPLRQRIPRPS
jgi:hypothetical protein